MTPANGDLELALRLAFCEHKMVNVISRRTLQRFAGTHADSLLDVRQVFADADQYKSLLIFNIRHNTYRLIVKADYRAKLLMVKAFLTHKEYNREEWKKWAR